MRLYVLFFVCSAMMTTGCDAIEDPGSRDDSRKSGSELMTYYHYYNDPTEMDPTYELAFDALPLDGQLAITPWTDTYWPKNKGGISYRWQTDESHDYDLIPYEDVLEMSEADIALLSPSEKYDLFVQNNDYALTQKVFSGNRASESSWQGYCHGWAMASIHFSEPSPVVMTNPDGLAIPFGASDVKALLTYFQGEIVSAERYSESQIPYKQIVRSVGTTCLSSDPQDPSCADTNPGAFHVVMTNQIGLRKKAFGIDATTTYEKWNQPVHTYRSEVIERKSARPDAKIGVVEEIIVQTRFAYTAEIEPQWDKTNETPLHKDHEKTVTYRLDLDAQGHIIDGEWLLLVDGGHFTLSGLYEYFLELDENQDGTPDLDEDRARAAVWNYFDFPDYVWVQDAGVFADEFEQAESIYTIMFNTIDSRRATYAYLAKLGEIYEASITP